jgi:hypothetical protein
VIRRTTVAVAAASLLGGDHVAGQPGVLEPDVGRGSVVLFGFQPNYRAQSMSTWPLLFNAIRK